MLGAAVASGRADGMATKLLDQGRGALQSSPELAKMANSAQRLFDAGRAAAVSAMNSKVESMGSKLEDQTGRVASIGGGRSGQKDEDEEQQDDGGGRGRTDEYEDEYEDEDEYDNDNDNDEDLDEENRDEDDEAEAEPAGARRSGSSKRPAVRKTGR
jgi:hypothetical protein